MCLENSKQSYAFLRALDEAGVDGLDLMGISRSMARISEQEFKSARYVTAPAPLASILIQYLEADGIARRRQGRFALTELGRRGLKTLLRFEIEPHRSRLLAEPV